MRRKVLFLVKAVVSLGLMAWIGHKVWERQDETDIWARLSSLRWEWIAAAACAQILAIGCSVVRWNRLLVGQGIRARYRHLIGSFMIGRFFGAFTPGGWTGLNGYRIYDIAKHTGKTARAATSIGIEMLLGQLAFGVVVIVGSIFGYRTLGLQGVVLLDGFFLATIALVLGFLSKPVLFQLVAARLPARVRPRVQSAVDAVCAYHGKRGLLIQATLLGLGTHVFNNLVFVASAQALGIRLGLGDVFFVTAMQIFSTLLPASINGIGLREATAVALYGRLGVSAGEAVLIPIVGFVIEMAISAWGGAWLLLRPVNYRPSIEVEDEEREARFTQAAASQQDAAQISARVHVGLAASAGLWAGLIVGLTESLIVLNSGQGVADMRIFFYGAVAYSTVCALALIVGVVVLRQLARQAAVWRWQRASFFAHAVAGVVAGLAFALGAFRIRRDVFHEMLVYKSARGLAVLGGCALVSLLLYICVWFAMRGLASRLRLAPWLLRWPHAALLPTVIVAGLAMLGLSRTAPIVGTTASKQRASNATPVLLVVVDTMRADRLPVYGYTQGKTPHLDAFAADSVVFNQAFANASWTRPSFATILSGRFPSSHRTMAKSDALPESVTTLSEAYQSAGYATSAVVTNYNVAPFFNFHQGFDDYRYLEPDFVLGANDTAAKLLLIQFLRQRIETFRAQRGDVPKGSAYRDAAEVNQALFDKLKANDRPWFMLAAYMDPHDPYYAHPYNGFGYSRAAHPVPDLRKAATLSKLYDGEITYWDNHFGALVAKLKALGIYDGMTIVVTSDHGEEFGEHGGFWHGTTLYDEQVHIPLLVKLPKQAKAGTRVDHWVQHVDIMPTLLQLSGLAVPKEVQGGDLFTGADEIFAEENHEGNDLSSLRTREGGLPIKVIRANPNNPRGLVSDELFRVDQDPAEQKNLHGQDSKLSVLADERLRSSKQRAASGAATRREVNVAHDQGAAARLKALGYVQ